MGHVVRFIPFFRAIIAILKLLKSSFLRYFEYIIDFCLYILLKNEKSNQLNSKVKTKLIKYFIFIFPWTDNTWILREQVIKVIKICSKSDSIIFFCLTKLERILPTFV